MSATYIISFTEVALEGDFDFADVSQIGARDSIEWGGRVHLRHQDRRSQSQRSPHAEPSHSNLKQNKTNKGGNVTVKVIETSTSVYVP